MTNTPDTQHVMVVISKEEYKKLFDEDYPDKDVPKYIGAWLTKSDLTEGIERWEDIGSPDALAHEDKLEAIQILEKVIKKYDDENVALTAKNEDIMAELNDIKDCLEKDQIEQGARRAMYNKRIAVKDEGINKLQDSLKLAESERDAYRRHFNKNLNFIQSFVRRLFRLP